MGRKGVMKFAAKCRAKINLFLYVTGLRDDGYHNIRTLFVPIDIYDTITITPATKTTLRCNLPHIPTNHKNIILKTDAILRAEYHMVGNFEIDLIKRIPSGAGLGGGSSDAAVYLKLVNKAASLNLTKDQMEEIMKRVGSDTVFFLRNRPAIGRGRGEILEDFKWLPPFHILLINPNIHISTKEIYSHPDLLYTDENIIPEITKPINFSEMTSLMKNDMEVPVFKMYPRVKELVDRISVGSGCGLMSGSGSTVFGVYEKAEDRDNAYEEFRAEYPLYFIKKAETVVDREGY